MSETRVDRTRVRRRTVLATGATILTGSTAGCIRQLRSVVNRDGHEQLSMTISTLPADGDREGIQLARRLRDVLESAGIDVALEMRSQEEYLRTILLNHDFDCFVGRHPGSTDPDFLYEALYSVYADELGWQNPFGYTNLVVDDLLERQRSVTGEERFDAVAAVLESIVAEQPFVPICVPEEHRVVRTERFDGWGNYHPATRLGTLGLEALEGTDRLRTVVLDARPSQNLNPISAEYRNRGTIVDLLYDSLATEIAPTSAEGIEHESIADAVEENEGPNTALIPWLAESWEWTDGTLEAMLRPDCRFHDGEPVTADDVEFTYEFLADTALGTETLSSPSPRYRGLVSAIDDVTATDEHRVSVSTDANEHVAERALTVPILPKHVWEPRSIEASVPGIRVAPGTTEAVTSDNVPPVGSGPFEFVDRAERDSVTLERFDDHFTRRESVDLPEASVAELTITIDPRSTSAIELVANDQADISLSTLETYAIDQVPESDGVETLESPSWTFYLLGFNVRSAPFSNPHFRRAVAQLIDREWLVTEVFDGYASPTATPVVEGWTPENLEWNGQAPEFPFLGSEGDLDVEAAREAFEEGGFRYDTDGRLLVRQ